MRTILLLLALGGCVCQTGPRLAAEPPAPPRPPSPALALPLPPPAPPPLPLAPPTDPDTIASLTPREVVAAAAVARADAGGYVAWKESKPDNIDKLTVLTRELDAAIAQMRAHETTRRYPPADVRSARTALQALRLFLKNKDD